MLSHPLEEAALSLSTFPVAGDWKSCLLWEQMATSPPILSGIGEAAKTRLKRAKPNLFKGEQKGTFFQTA